MHSSADSDIAVLMLQPTRTPTSLATCCDSGMAWVKDPEAIYLLPRSLGQGFLWLCSVFSVGQVAEAY